MRFVEKGIKKIKIFLGNMKNTLYLCTMINDKTYIKYLNQYLNEWRESTQDLYTTEDLMNAFLQVKANQFDLKWYKKSLKNRAKVVEPFNFD